MARVVALVYVLIERVACGQADNQDSAQLGPLDGVEQRLHHAHERWQDFRKQRIVDRAQVLKVFFDRETERPAQIDAVGCVVRAAQEVLAHRDVAPPVRIGVELRQERPRFQVRGNAFEVHARPSISSRSRGVMANAKSSPG